MTEQKAQIQPPKQPKKKMFIISEDQVGFLQNFIGGLSGAGLDWFKTNPPMQVLGSLMEIELSEQTAPPKVVTPGGDPVEPEDIQDVPQAPKNGSTSATQAA